MTLLSFLVVVVVLVCVPPQGPEASATVARLLDDMRQAGQTDIVAINTIMKAYVSKVRLVSVASSGGSSGGQWWGQWWGW